MANLASTGSLLAEELPRANGFDAGAGAPLGEAGPNTLGKSPPALLPGFGPAAGSG